MYKHQTNSLPRTFSDYFIKHSHVHSFPQEMLKVMVFIKQKKKNSDQAIRNTGPVLRNTLDAEVKCCKLLSILEMYLNQVLLWTMINFDGFWHMFVLWLLVFFYVYFVWFFLSACNLSSRGMALSGLFLPFAISSISLSVVCFLMLFWCRLYDIENKSWILSLKRTHEHLSLEILVNNYWYGNRKWRKI